jgi:Zn-finger nucleic acid-binding protein
VSDDLRSASASARPCPRCQAPLEAKDLHGATVLACRQCAGTLVAQLELTRLLEGMSAELLATFDPDAQLARVADRGGNAPCPHCKKAMAGDDYCGAGLVRFNRCEACGVLWLDGGELGAMTLMWARMHVRLERVKAENRAQLADAQVFVDRVRLQRLLVARLFGAIS